MQGITVRLTADMPAVDMPDYLGPSEGQERFSDEWVWWGLLFEHGDTS